MPAEYTENARAPPTCALPILMTFYYFSFWRVRAIGVGVIPCSFLLLTPTLPTTGGTSCPQAMCQTSLAATSISTALTGLAATTSPTHHVPPLGPIISSVWSPAAGGGCDWWVWGKAEFGVLLTPAPRVLIQRVQQPEHIL